MVDTQLQPLDLSCPAKRPLSPDLSPSSSYSDIRRLSSGSESEEERPQDLSREGEELSGPARKRFLSKFFRDPKGRSLDGGVGAVDTGPKVSLMKPNKI